jgi:hypothetical protein
MSRTLVQDRKDSIVRTHSSGGCPATTRPLYRSYPTPSNCGIHTLNQNESERGEICASIFGQSKKSSMLKAVRKGFLDGCPNINAKLILKYLNPSPATAKGHMKRPCHSIKSTTPRQKATQPDIVVPLQPVTSSSESSEQTSVIFSEQSLSEYNTQRPILIVEDSERFNCERFCI